MSFCSIGINCIKNAFTNLDSKKEKISEFQNNNKLDSIIYEDDEIIDNDIDVDNNIIDDINESSKSKESSEFDWYIEIPKIKLYAPIEDGTSDEILNRSVGHFENTARRNGNCGLAAHNRGYRVNYFARLKELKKGDIINYFVDGKQYMYKIDQINIIYETDWSMLEDTKEDKITLITCIENRDEYRLCVQGSLIEE